MGKNSELGLHTHILSNEAGFDPAFSGLSASQAEARVVDELRSEIKALRREVRMLRMTNAELERVAVRDTLTPLYNRRYFVTVLNEQLERARRYQTRSAVLFLDINKMKIINDQFGHNAGDFALIHVAQILQDNIRGTDIAARIGGDEFAVILDHMDEEQAEAKAEQLDEILRKTACVYCNTTLPVSASIGFTMLQANDTDDALIERADANMYANKRRKPKTIRPPAAANDSAAA